MSQTPPPLPNEFAPPSPAAPVAPPTMPGMLGTPKPRGMAVASLILGISSCITFCCCYGIIALPAGIMAIVFGKIGMGEVDKGRADPASRPMAKAGFILGIVGIAIWLIYHIAILVIYGSLIAAGSFQGWNSGTP